MKKWHLIIFGVACGLLASGLILLIASPPRGAPVTLLPQPTPSPLLVYVTGAVEKPGVYELPLNSRLQNAIELAGGLMPDADITAINMAEKVNDGQKIFVPLVGEITDPSPSASEKSGAAAAAPSGPININTANAEELDTLPGIGPAKAAAIIEFRNANGPFESLEDLLEVPGIGEKICEDIQDLITIH
jgi:competence protein ComEA